VVGSARPLSVRSPSAPLTETQLEQFEWFNPLFTYTELRGDDDPDAELIPQLVRKCVFPEVTRRLRDCWDITSSKQTARAVALFDECVQFAAEGDDEVALPELVTAALACLERGLSEHAPEVFVPSEQLPRWYASAARYRLLWRSCKIASCAAMLDERVPDKQLQDLVLGSIYATRIAPHLRSPRIDTSELAVVESFVASLPARWLDAGMPPMLVGLRDALGPRAPA